MHKDQAELYLAATNGDPFVAAWVAVIDANDMPPHTPIAEQDWWESFQELYFHDLIPTYRFGNIDISKTFFGSKRPSPVAVHRACSFLKLMRADSAGEEKSMSDKKFAMFEDASANAVIVRSDGNGLTNGANGGGYPFGGGSPSGMQMFESQPQPQSFGMFERRESHAALSTPTVSTPFIAFEARPTTAVVPFAESTINGGVLNRAGVVDGRAYVEEADVEIRCCGQFLNMNQDDGDAIEPDDPSEPAMLEMVLYGECPTCKSTMHVSIAKPIDRGIFL